MNCKWQGFRFSINLLFYQPFSFFFCYFCFGKYIGYILFYCFIHPDNVSLFGILSLFCFYILDIYIYSGVLGFHRLFVYDYSSYVFSGLTLRRSALPTLMGQRLSFVASGLLVIVFILIRVSPSLFFLCSLFPFVFTYVQLLHGSIIGGASLIASSRERYLIIGELDYRNEPLTKSYHLGYEEGNREKMNDTLFVSINFS